ncbi:hypothetical protein BCR36DRAFT_406522 [Piromyces finnis]|uniref:Uncharacterized protein n=1 Tax=Piromyces finnis TaxID=1754191 RepID=A0A1Y1UZN3_9FUNG|nr:hypothetical protein BCR36DRAFT_406522 [Piromyces finnis]|eukprot:ORX44186.1 hypothetical protein BCR36DRAFT_406522 [Piromyces finnis]
MPLFKCIGSHPKEPKFTYFDKPSQPIHIKLGNISAVYSNKKWKLDNNNDDTENYHDDFDKDKLKKLYNKKLLKRNEELENENQQLKWKIELLLSKLAEAKYEIEQLQDID